MSHLGMPPSQYYKSLREWRLTMMYRESRVRYRGRSEK